MESYKVTWDGYRMGEDGHFKLFLRGERDLSTIIDNKDCVQEWQDQGIELIQLTIPLKEREV